MADVVVTVPKGIWNDWLDEGDIAGEPRGTHHPSFKIHEDQDGMLEWHFYLGWNRPNIEPGERVYIVSHGRLRGYSPLVRVERDLNSGRYALVRHHDAKAVTIMEPITGFQGFKYRWWFPEQEYDFQDWQTAGVKP